MIRLASDTESMKLYTIHVSIYNSVNLRKREKIRYNNLQTYNLEQNPSFSTPFQETPVNRGHTSKLRGQFRTFQEHDFSTLIFISLNFELRLTEYKSLTKRQQTFPPTFNQFLKNTLYLFLFVLKCKIHYI